LEVLEKLEAGSLDIDSALALFRGRVVEMSQDVENEQADHLVHSVGGRGGYLLRRSIHLLMATLPILFYWHGDEIAAVVCLSAERLVSLILLLLIAAEALRLTLGLTVYGQRDYEAKQVSAVAWGGISVGLVLLAAPRPAGLHPAAIGAPLIWSLSVADPLMGEVRRLGGGVRAVVISGGLAVFASWLGAAFWLGTPGWLVPLMTPATVAAEWPRLPWIDDNATMLLIPLAICLILSPWF
jgi:hypothetical protein